MGSETEQTLTSSDLLPLLMYHCKHEYAYGERLNVIQRNKWEFYGTYLSTVTDLRLLRVMRILLGT